VRKPWQRPFLYNVLRKKGREKSSLKSGKNKENNTLLIIFKKATKGRRTVRLAPTPKLTQTKKRTARKTKGITAVQSRTKKGKKK